MRADIRDGLGEIPPPVLAAMDVDVEDVCDGREVRDDGC